MANTIHKNLDASYLEMIQTPAPGTPLELDSAPTLFQPLQVRGVTLHNRIVVSPMCTYSAKDGHLTDFHMVHLGQYALGGAALVMIEATAVEPRGRISPQDSGLWTDSQVAPLRKVVNFIQSQGSKTAIQLAHSGRKASTANPWVSGATQKVFADQSLGGWLDDVVGASAIPWADHYVAPKDLSTEEIEQLVQKFAESAKRAVQAGIDIIEIHSAHGYLLNSFLSPLSNVRHLIST